MALAAALAVAFAGTASAQSVDQAEAAIVRVAVILDSPDGRVLAGAGSGFVVAPNLVLTNAHVVAQARQRPEFQVVIVTQRDETAFTARIIAYSALNEMALLEYRGGADLAPVTLSTADPNAGDTVIALGYPDVDFQGASGADLLRPSTPSRTSGEIASLRDRTPTGDRMATINHQAVISSGSSGGPLLDTCGRVIGINAWHVRGVETRETRSVATRIAPVLEFLDAAGIRPRVTEERCLSAEERAEAERQETLRALQQQNQELAAKLETADRLTRIAMVVLIAGTLSLFVAVCVLGAALLSRRRARGQAAEPFEPKRRRGSIATVLGIAALAAIIVLAAGLLLLRPREAEPGPALSDLRDSAETTDGG